MVSLASFPSCEERHCCNISIYLMKTKTFISIRFIFLLCFTEVRNGGSVNDTKGWVLSCAEARWVPEQRTVSEPVAGPWSFRPMKQVEQQRLALITGSFQRPHVNYGKGPGSGPSLSSVVLPSVRHPLYPGGWLQQGLALQ